MKLKGNREKADNLFKLLKLDNVPITPKDKDRRYLSRNEARSCAMENKEGLAKMDSPSTRKEYLESIKRLAKAVGFFSVWMEVFKDDEEVKKILISAFKGTKEEYCKN